MIGGEAQALPADTVRILYLCGTKSHGPVHVGPSAKKRMVTVKL